MATNYLGGECGAQANQATVELGACALKLKRPTTPKCENAQRFSLKMGHTKKKCFTMAVGQSAHTLHIIAAGQITRKGP